MITIKNNKSLQKLAEGLNLEPKDLIKKLSKEINLIILAYEENYEYFCGKTILDFKKLDLSLVRLALNFFVGNNSDLIELLDSLIIINELKDCPECGCETTKTEESYKKYKWENTTCSHCDYASTTEPDWDSMAGGKDFNNN